MTAEPSSRPRTVVIAGGSGFLGQGLTPHLLERGDRVVVLSRTAKRPHGVPEDVAWVSWDAKTLGPWAETLDGARALINFVGRSVDCRKTEENRRDILASRVDSCLVLGLALRAVEHPPPVWIQSSTAHIVGDPVPLDTVCDEATPAGPQAELAPSVAVKWEEAFEAARLPAQRGVALRISFVLGPDGGALRRLHTVTKWGLGGTVGSGRQWVSWIHQHDLNRIICAAVDDERFRGAYMVTSPNPVTNRVFMRALRRAHRRPWSPPAPALAVRLAARFFMDTDPDLPLKGRRCVPTRLLDEHDFVFRHPQVGDALRDLM